MIGLGGNALDTSAAALATSTWLTWTTCGVTSGRRRDARHVPGYAPGLPTPTRAQ
ncbi:MAG: hypothetical protein M3303_14050 [Gemmatimonadota bacterium]|nr:hypothetical protein [Gemmatimonadota bacterium]